MSKASQKVRREELERGLRLARILEARRRRFPLAYCDLWDAPPPRTSQRRALQELVVGVVLVLLILGGNRSGKSYLMAQWLVANAMGSDYCVVTPAGRRYPVREWLARNGLPENLIPEGPGEVWCGSPNFPVSIGQIRAHIKKLVPEGSRFVGWDAPAEARIVLPNGGQIISKAYKQFDLDNQTWEGANVRCIGLDEQPNSYENFLAALSRLIDQSGQLVNALTPLRGKNNWFYREIAGPKALAANPDYRAVHLFGEDNPHIPQEVRSRILAKFPRWQRAARERGEFVNPEGTVYPLNPDVHVLQPFAVPKDWIRFAAVDWGGRQPHILWAAIVQSALELPGGRRLERGDLVAYREYAVRRTLQEGRLPQELLIAEGLRMEKAAGEGPDGVMVFRVADSEDPGAIERAASLGWPCVPIKKAPGSLVHSIGLVESMMQTVEAQVVEGETEPRDRRPTLYLTTACPVTIEELGELRWAADDKVDEDARPDPTCADHGPDCLRYIVMHASAMGLL